MDDMNGSLGFAVASLTGSAAAPVLDFGEFFDAEHARLYAALCIVTRNRHEAEEVVFAYSVHKANSVRGKQSTGEACAKHLKEKINTE